MDLGFFASYGYFGTFKGIKTLLNLAQYSYF